MKSVVAAVLLSLSMLVAWMILAHGHGESPDALDADGAAILDPADRAASPRRSIGADADSRKTHTAASSAEAPPRRIEIALSGVDFRKGDRSRFLLSNSTGESRSAVVTDTRGDGVYRTDLPAYRFSAEDGLLPHVTLSIDHPRAERVEGTWHLDSLARLPNVDPPTVRIAVRLSPAKEIRGIVVDDRGRPIDGAVVGAYDLGEGIFPPIHENIAFSGIDGRERTLLNHNRKSETCPVTDAHGRFEIRVPLRKRLLVAASFEGFEEAATTIDGSDASPIQDLTLRLRAAVKISGRAVLAGRPFSGTIYATPIGGPNLGKYDPRAGYQGPIEVFSLNGRIVEWLGGTLRTAFTGGEYAMDHDGRFSIVGLQDGASHDLILRPTDADDTVVSDQIARRFSKTVVAPENDLDFDIPAAILDISVKSKTFEGTIVDIILKGDACATLHLPCRPGATRKVLWPPLGSVEISIFDPRFEMPTAFAVAPKNGETQTIVLEPKAIGGCPQLSLTLTGENARKIRSVKVRWTPLDDDTRNAEGGATLLLADDLLSGDIEVDGGLGFGKPYDPRIGIRLRRGIDLVTGLENETVTDRSDILRRRTSTTDEPEAEEVSHARTFRWLKIDVAEGRYVVQFTPIVDARNDGSEPIRFADMTEIVKVDGNSIDIRKVPVRGRTIAFWPQSRDGRLVQARCEIAEPSGEFPASVDDALRAKDPASHVIETPVLPFGRRSFRFSADGFHPRIVEFELTETSIRTVAVVLDPLP